MKLERVKEVSERAWRYLNKLTARDKAIMKWEDEAEVFSELFDWNETPQGRVFWSNINKKLYPHG